VDLCSIFAVYLLAW